MILSPARAPGLCALMMAAALVSACSNSKDKKGRGNQGPAEVGYVVVQPGAVPITTELSGRVNAYASSEVRPQVAGIIRKRFFVEGSVVQKGQTLYQIDPSLYVASANQARANLASAQANAEATQTKAARYKPLADMEAVAKQDYTDVAAQARQAAASVAQNRAALDTARINLRFTRVPAPITGRIGRSLFTEGALVTAAQADPLTTIQRLDPIYVDMQQSSSDLLAMRRALASGGAQPATAAVHLKLEDGSDYGLTGTVQFAEVMVSESTGTVTLRATFPNPQGMLLPGMFVRASFSQATDPNAFLIPQQAVTRDPKGNATVFVLQGNKAVSRTVTATRTQGAFWVVTAGLKPGERVITEGLGKVKDQGEVKAVPAGSAQTLGGGGAGARSGKKSG